MSSTWTKLAIVWALAVGCGGGAAEGGEGTTPDSTAGEIAGPPEPWEQMSFDAKKRYMAAEVVPVMSELFVAFDRERYEGFGCQTCHGENAQERQFAMPSPSLPALHPTGTPEQQAMVEQHPEMVRFMFNQVVPTMQRLLGAQPYDAETQSGFSCYACHPRATEGMPAHEHGDHEH